MRTGARTSTEYRSIGAHERAQRVGSWRPRRVALITRRVRLGFEGLGSVLDAPHLELSCWRRSGTRRCSACSERAKALASVESSRLLARVQKRRRLR
jgi:hypothetical protein